MEFRKLKASEIDARVSTIRNDGCSLLLYKDARVDQNILDETVGAENWQRSHDIIGGNLYCTVSIWDEDKKMWVSKQDVGTESYTEKEKGQASDSFKRACFNWGIGRELYTAPFIWVKAGDVKIEEKNGKSTTYDSFSVKAIGYDKEGNINQLKIYNNKLKRVVFTLGKSDTTPETEEESFDKQAEQVKKSTISKKDQEILKHVVESKGYSVEQIFTKPLSELTGEEYVEALNRLNGQK
jgi:hypothetical protein